MFYSCDVFIVVFFWNFGFAWCSFLSDFCLNLIEIRFCEFDVLYQNLIFGRRVIWDLVFLFI